MSAQPSVDQLKDIVSTTLEAKGVLGTIRAQLRAAVFTALDEQERASGIYLENPAAKSISESATSSLLAGLLREYLEFHDLERTQSVFVSEANLTLVDYQGRQKLGRDLGLAEDVISNTTRPLLLELLLGHMGESCQDTGAGTLVAKGIPESDAKE